MNQKTIRAAVEAMLFAYGEPVGADKLAQALQLPTASVEEALEDLHARYAREDSGLCLLHLNTHWQLATKTDFAEPVRRVLDTRRSVPLGSSRRRAASTCRAARWRSGQRMSFCGVLACPVWKTCRPSITIRKKAGERYERGAEHSGRRGRRAALPIKVHRHPAAGGSGAGGAADALPLLRGCAVGEPTPRKKAKLTLNIVCTILRGAGKLTKAVFGALRITKINICLGVRGEDPADAARSYGKLNAWLGGALGLLDRFLYLDFEQLRLVPDLGPDQPTVEDRVSFRVTAQAYAIVFTALRVLYEFWHEKVLDLFL